MEKNDLRVVKTRESIEEQFLVLLQKMSFHEITVSMLIQQSRINRSTFYRNYEDKYALLEAVEKPLLEQLCQLLSPPFLFLGYENFKEYLPRLSAALAFFRENSRRLTILWSASLPHSFFERMEGELISQVYTALENKFSLSPEQKSSARLHAALCATHFLTYVRWWIDDGMRISEDQLLSMMDKVMEQGLFSAMEDHYGESKP